MGETQEEGECFLLLTPIEGMSSGGKRSKLIILAPARSLCGQEWTLALTFTLSRPSPVDV